MTVWGVSHRRSYNPELVRSKAFPHRNLVDGSGNLIHKYGYYMRLRTNVAWKVSVIYGRHPVVPDESAPASEKGAYALFFDVAVPTSPTH